RPRVQVDLKSPDGVAVAQRLAQSADALIEGFRPGVMERLGLGPDVLLERNPRLVYGRMTGYGQHGPMASVAGHDINYISDSGAPFYEVYETSDGRFVSVGALEPQFYAELLRLLDVEPDSAPQWDQSRWPELKERFAGIFKTRTRDEWAALLEPADACATPV